MKKPSETQAKIGNKICNGLVSAFFKLREDFFKDEETSIEDDAIFLMACILFCTSICGRHRGESLKDKQGYIDGMVIMFRKNLTREIYGDNEC